MFFAVVVVYESVCGRVGIRSSFTSHCSLIQNIFMDGEEIKPEMTPAAEPAAAPEAEPASEEAAA